MLCGVQNRVAERRRTSFPVGRSWLLTTITTGFLDVTGIQVLFSVCVCCGLGFFYLPGPKGPMAKQNWPLHWSCPCVTSPVLVTAPPPFTPVPPQPRSAPAGRLPPSPAAQRSISWQCFCSRVTHCIFAPDGRR